MQIAHLMNATKTSVPSVVLNDIPNAAVTVTTAPRKEKKSKPHVVSTIETLISDRKAWEDGVYRTSNEQLYALLQRIYTLYRTLSGSEHKTAAEQFLNYCATKGFRFKESTHLIAKVVRCVFDDKAMDRRRISTYSLVLRAAHKQVIDGKLKMDAIADFVRDMGGVEQIRLAKSPTALTPKQKAEAAAKMDASDLAVVESESLAKCMVIDKSNNYAVLLAMQNADGTFAVRSLIYNDGVVNAALAAFYGKQKTVNESDKVQAELVDNEQQKDTAVEAAAKEIVELSV